MTDRFISPEPPPSPYQREILEILIEECGEVIQRATKMLRFGVLEVQPGQDLNNTQRLAMEIGDLLEVTNHVNRAGLCPNEYVEKGMAQKADKLQRYMQNGPETAG